MTKVELALNNYKKGYTCSQAVFCAFHKELNLSEETAYKVSESFGKGMGGLGQTCGAMSGLFMIISYTNSNFDNIGKTKFKTYELVKEYGDKFKELNTYLDCSSLRNARKRSCLGCIEDATNLTEEYFNKYFT